MQKRAPRIRMKPWLSLRIAVDWDCCTTVLNCSSCHPDHIPCDDALHSATWFRQSRESAQLDQLHQRPQALAPKNKRNALESPNNGRTCSAVMPVGPPVAHLLDERRFCSRVAHPTQTNFPVDVNKHGRSGTVEGGVLLAAHFNASPGAATPQLDQHLCACCTSSIANFRPFKQDLVDILAATSSPQLAGSKM